MSWFTSHLLDPMELSLRIADDRAMEYMEALIEGLDKKKEVDDGGEAVKVLENIRESISLLPEREADFVDLYYFHYKTQTEIAFLFRVSQPTVCYRLQRAAKRIHFLLSRPTLSDEMMRKMKEDFHQVLKDPDDVRIMELMYETSCQSVAAKELGVSQGRVRHRLMRSLKILERYQHRSEDFKVYYEMFRLITSLPNIRREVQRPTSSSKMRCILDCDPTPDISSFAVIGESEEESEKKVPPLPDLPPMDFSELQRAFLLVSVDGWKKEILLSVLRAEVEVEAIKIGEALNNFLCSHQEASEKLVADKIRNLFSSHLRNH